MAYTHYWYRKAEISRKAMQAIAADFSKIVLALDDLGIRLGDMRGHGAPVITADLIGFNGLAACGHPKLAAQGVMAGKGSVGSSLYTVGQLAPRVCGGDCSYESFYFPRVWHPEWKKREPEMRREGLYLAYCGTAFRPYDLAVTAFLVIAKHHLGEEIRVSSDGQDQCWEDAKRLCFLHLGYGLEYAIREVKKDDWQLALRPKPSAGVRRWWENHVQ